jgi:glycosyltransferase involved in cell wall biosynthesis
VPPLVSVVIPCYNYARYLPEAVESVVRQTYDNWEIIIVNDGSTDNTQKVAEGLIVKYAKQKIQLINQANSGQPAAVRNAGIAVAHGEFILPLDADDKIAPTFLEKTVAVLKDSPKVGVAYTHIQHFGTLKSVYQCGTFCTETLVRDNILPYASLYRRRLWQETGGYRTNVGYEDWDFWLTLAEKGVLGLLVPEPLFFYRKHGVSRLGADNDRRNQMIAQLYANHPKLYSSKQVEDARKYLASLTGSIGTLGGINAGSRRLSITYLISSILGVTGGNQTLLNQSNAMVRKGHSVTIVTYTDKPAFMQVLANVIKVPDGEPMSKYVPVSDVVVGTYFLNALELKNITAKVKVYFAQGDQFVFEDSSAKLSAAQKKQLRDWKQLSKESYRQTDVKFIANSLNLASAVENKYGRNADAIIPVCIDQTVFRPLQRSLLNTKPRILIVGPDIKGSAMEPLTFKGIGDIRIALEKLIAKKIDFTAVRMSNSTPEIFKDFPCEFYAVPNDELKTFLYGSATILVYASHYDSCPIPPLEAMAAGAAVVCTATTGAIEYCRTEENCLLVPIQSPDELCNAIQRLLDDPMLRKKLIRGGYNTAKQYPREREWDEMEQLFFQYIQEKQNKHGVPGIINDGKIFKEIQTRLSNKQFTDVLSMTDAMPLDTKQTGNEEVLIMQGCAQLGLRDLEKAKISFEHALKINPKSSEACSGLGEVFFLAEMDKESKVMFEWAVVNDVENMNARKGLAKTNKVLQLNSANNSLLYPGIDDMIEKAEGKINCGEIDEARAILTEVMNLDKYHLDALNDLSVCSIIDNNIEKAIELIAIILTIDPDNEIAVENITLINQQTPEVISE